MFKIKDTKNKGQKKKRCLYLIFNAYFVKNFGATPLYFVKLLKFSYSIIFSKSIYSTIPYYVLYVHVGDLIIRLIKKIKRKVTLYNARRTYVCHDYLVKDGKSRR